MNVLRRLEPSVTMLADAGFDPVGSATLVELRTAIVARATKLTATSEPSEIFAVIHLIDELETLADRLCAEHRAIESINTVAA